MRTCRPGPSQPFADGLRDLRVLRRLTQDDVAEQMRAMDHATWSRATVSEIERYGRAVTVDEMLSLALVFGTTPAGLLAGSQMSSSGS